MKKRITLYTDKNSKAILVQAAKIRGLSLSSYIRLVSLEHAKNELNDIKVDDSNWNSLINELDNPSKPNSALKNMFKR